MNKNKTVSVIGGDSRLIYAAEFLASHGYKVSAFYNEHGKIPESVKKGNELKDAFEGDIILLPLPVTKNGKMLNSPLSSSELPIKEITDGISERNTVFLGMGSTSLLKQLSAKAGAVCDYFTIESLTYKNALLTAEGLLGIILERSPLSLFSMKIAVTGYGRIGAFLAGMLKMLGADVSVFARNEIQRIKAEAIGIKANTMHHLEEDAQLFDCIINTVPSPVINEKAIRCSKPECIFIEAASQPYGIDSDACTRNARTLIKAFSLPGKTSPKTAGIIIAETVIKKEKELMKE